MENGGNARDSTAPGPPHDAAIGQLVAPRSGCDTADQCTRDKKQKEVPTCGQVSHDAPIVGRRMHGGWLGSRLGTGRSMCRDLGALRAPGALDMVCGCRGLEGRLVATHLSRPTLDRHGPRKVPVAQRTPDVVEEVLGRSHPSTCNDGDLRGGAVVKDHGQSHPFSLRSICNVSFAWCGSVERRDWNHAHRAVAGGTTP